MLNTLLQAFSLITTWEVIVAMLAVTMVVHPLAALGMVALGLKARVG